MKSAGDNSANAASTSASASGSTSFTKSESLVRVIKGGHQHKIKNARAFRLGPAHSIYSNEFTVNGHVWQIVSYLGGETEEVAEHVSLFLGYVGPAQQCRANWLLRCVNQRDPSKSRVREWKKGDKYNIFQQGRRWGWQKFVLQKQAFQDDTGFLGEDDSLCFEAEVEVHGHIATTRLPVKRGCQMPSYEGLAAQCHESLSLDLDKLLQNSNEFNDPFVDTEIQCGDRNFRLHSQILAARSPVFARMLNGSFKERADLQNDSIKFKVSITDIDPAIFNEVIRYIYSGNVNMSALGFRGGVGGGSNSDVEETEEVTDRANKKAKSRKRQHEEDEDDETANGQSPLNAIPGSNLQPLASIHKKRKREAMSDEVEEVDIRDSTTISKSHEDFDLVASVMEAADKYEVTHLRKLCESYLMQIITPRTAIDTLLLADRHSATELKEHTLRYLGVVSNLKQVRKYSALEWQKLDKSLIDEILNSVATDVSNAPESAASPPCVPRSMLVGPNVAIATTTAALTGFPQLQSQQQQQQQFVLPHFFQPFTTATPAAFFF